MQNAQQHSCGDQLASHAVILRLLHFLANVTAFAIRKSFSPAKAAYNNSFKQCVIRNRAPRCGGVPWHNIMYYTTALDTDR